MNHSLKHSYAKPLNMMCVDKIFSVNDACFPDDEGVTFDEPKKRLEKVLQKFNAVMLSIYL